jgi:hypothetical protein
MTPRTATDKICIDCLGLSQFSTKKIEDCEGDTAMNGACPIYPYRMGGRISVKKIRKYCLYCQGNSSKSVEECTTFKCSYFPYRFGKSPAHANRRFRTPFHLLKQGV